MAAQRQQTMSLRRPNLPTSNQPAAIGGGNNGEYNMFRRSLVLLALGLAVTAFLMPETRATDGSTACA